MIKHGEEILSLFNLNDLFALKVAAKFADLMHQLYLTTVLTSNHIGRRQKLMSATGSGPGF